MILALEILIALYVHDTFVRPFLGDVLVVVLLYAGFRTILKTAASKVLIGVVCFAFFVEFLQFINFADTLAIADHSVGEIILGSTFDLLAYLLGGVVAYFFGRMMDQQVVCCFFYPPGRGVIACCELGISQLGLLE